VTCCLNFIPELNYVALVCEQTILIERPPLVSEVSASFCRCKMLHGQHNGSPWPYSRISRPKQLLLLPSCSSIVLTRLSGPCARPTTLSENLVALGIELETSGSVARNSDH
jgi:hypothetical protein